MASLAQRSFSHGVCHHTCRGAGVPAPGLATINLRRDCRSFAGYKARVASPEKEETKEYKIAKLAEILGTSPEHMTSLVRLRPGLLVVPNGDMTFYEQRVAMLAFKHGVSPRQVREWVLEHPDLLFQRV